MGFRLTEPEVRLTPVIADHVRMGLAMGDALSATQRTELKKYSKQNEKSGEATIPFKTIRWLHEKLQNSENGATESVDERVRCRYLHELLSGSSLHIPPLPKPERNPELEARCRRLEREQRERDYQRMVSDVSNTTVSTTADLSTEYAKAVKSSSRGLIIVVNVVLTVAASFVFGFFATRYSMPEPNLAAEALVGVVVATVVAVADLYFVIKTGV